MMFANSEINHRSDDETLVGRVVDEQGKLIEGVNLRLETWEPIEYRDFDRHAKTDANGEFRLEHLPEGKITLRLDKKGYLYMNGQPAEVEPDQPVTTMKTPIVMQKGTRVYGKVVDAETGKPIRNFKIKADFPRKLEPADIRPDGISVEGIVVDAETGVPLASAFITAFDKNHPLSIGSFTLEHQAAEPVRTNAQGKFALPGALADEFYLYVTHPERAPAIAGPLHVPTDEKPQPIRVEMQRGGVVTGKATPGLKITLRLLGHERYPMVVQFRTRASHEDIYRFENLTPGKYQMYELIPGEGFASSGRSIQFELEPKETKTFNFLRTGKARVYGKVTEADGAPIKNVVVRIMGRPQNIPKPLLPVVKLSPKMKLKMDIEYSGVAITDAGGNYEIAGLPPGNYRVNARVETFLTPGEIEAARRAERQVRSPSRRETRKSG
ncbi:TPA: carboxypeptidase regulatory-like domain-containing protein [Candidatus Poribacteria bacterium]|nr:carboxypeptidase regulatory-like domain-containing protein [Candidatus Poribacteria bacterium]